MRCGWSKCVVCGCNVCLGKFVIGRCRGYFVVGLFILKFVGIFFYLVGLFVWIINYYICDFCFSIV